MPALTRSKYRGLLEDPDFRRWYENVSRGSLATAQEWFRRMGLVRDRFGVAPGEIAKMSQGRASDFLLDVVGALDKEGRSGTYIASQAGTGSPQQVGRLCMRVLDRAKRVLDLIYEAPAQP
ncbi:MAG: hypothetical protein JRN06_09050 [Nitrososphaerota archaeon]|nr:hypothetical protein [Nitrososphaerota archaeon]MDG7024551.1 hypothetical protein [Nitrososphaerota archaeon]